MPTDRREKGEPLVESDHTREYRRLLDAFAQSAKELIRLHQEQFDAILQSDPECTRFDLLIHMANETKQQAKYELMRHMELHSSSNAFNVTNITGNRSDY